MADVEPLSARMIGWSRTDEDASTCIALARKTRRKKLTNKRHLAADGVLIYLCTNQTSNRWQTLFTNLKINPLPLLKDVPAVVETCYGERPWKVPGCISRIIQRDMLRYHQSTL